MPPAWINFGGILSVPCHLYHTEKLEGFKENEKQ